MNKILMFVLVLATASVMSACSDGADEASKSDHVWKGQVEAIDKAKSVEQTLKDEAERQAEQAD